MKKILLLLFLSVGCQYLSVNAADKKPYPGGKYSIYRLTLKDKKGTTYSLAHPEAFLSAKALQRRNKQHITVDSTDLPVSARYLERIKTEKGEVIGQSKWNNTVLVKVSDSTSLKHLTALPFVVKATKVFTTPDSIATLTPDSVEKDTIATKAPRTPPANSMAQSVRSAFVPGSASCASSNAGESGSPGPRRHAGVEYRQNAHQPQHRCVPAARPCARR